MAKSTTTRATTNNVVVDIPSHKITLPSRHTTQQSERYAHEQGMQALRSKSIPAEKSSSPGKAKAPIDDIVQKNVTDSDPPPPHRESTISLRSRSHLNRLRASGDERPHKPNKKPARWSWTSIAAAAILCVCAVLIGLSLSHLAEGVQIVTGCGTAAAWSMAIGIDLAFVALEFAMLVSPDDIRPAVSRHASPAIQGTLALSAAMNAFAFASHAQGVMVLPGISFSLPWVYPAILLGITVPALIYALTKTAATLAFHKA